MEKVAFVGDSGLNKVIHIALTGHRPDKLWGYDLGKPEYDKLQRRLEEIIDVLLIRYEQVVCHSGLALGADTVWSIAVLNKREQYPNRVRFHAEIPFMGQATKWFGDSVNFWEYQVSNADSKTVYLTKKEDEEWSKIPKYKISKALNDRNKGMVTSSDILIAVHNGSKSGTQNAINDAKKLNKYILEWHPDEFK